MNLSWTGLLSVVSLLLPLLTPRLEADAPASAKAATAAAASLYEGIRQETLPNGLRVVLKPVAHSPVVTTMVAYKVGSADEDLDNTGLSHYLEHLMFKGTGKIMPGDIDRMTLRNGGANNANTSEDLTVYHFDFAADRWDEALVVEADRMRNLRVDAKHEFEQEKGAVIEELKRDEDQPWDLEQKAILPLLFGKTDPYGHPVIGETAHVRGATAAVIKAHYDKWYHPNNATLVVCGGFDPDKALARIKQLFGPIPKVELPPRKAAAEVVRKEPVHREIVSKFDVLRMVMGFNTVKTGDPDFYALEVVQNLLAGGKTGRLYKELVEGKEIATSVDASSNTGRYPGWFEVQVELLKGKNCQQAENLVLEQLRRLADQPVPEAELNRAKQNLVAGVVFGRESVHNLADSLARGVSLNGLEFVKAYLPRILAVTARDVQKAARTYLDSQRRVVVWSVPRPREAAGEGKADTPSGRRNPNRAARVPNEAGVSDFSLTSAQTVKLDNGLTLLLFENRRLPIVVAEAYVPNVRLLEPEAQAGIATLTGRLMAEGTDRHTGPQIAELIEDVGGQLSLSASGGTVKVLSPDHKLGLGLLLECLSRAKFPKEAFAREQQRLLSQIDDAEHQPDSKAARVFEELVYGKHPYGRPALGRHNTVAALKPADCAAFHAKIFGPNNTVLAVVGDFDSEQLIDEVKAFTADWKAAPAPKPEVPAVAMPEHFTEKVLTMPGAVQLHFLMGHPGVRRDNPDYYKLLVMDYVLGTGPGFTDRLSARLRDREGLAYTVTANITSSATEQPGVFTCYIGTDPKSFARVKEMFLQELNRLRDKAPTPEEVTDAKEYLVGNLPFHFTTDRGIAGQLLAVHRYHLGLDYLEHYRKAVLAVTPEDVRDVARRYLHPDKMVLVAAGPVDAKGKAVGERAAPRAPDKD